MTKIYPGLQQVRGAGMAQRVQRHRPQDTRPDSGLPHDVLEAAFAVVLTGLGAFEKTGLGAVLLALLLDEQQQTSRQGAVAVLPAFLPADAQHHSPGVNRLQAKNEHFIQAQTQTVGRREHCPVLEVDGALDEGADFFPGPYS